MKKLSAVIGLAVLFFVLLACKKGEGSHCYLNKDCKDNLVCLSENQECATLETGDSVCGKSSLCKSLGMCKASRNVAAEQVVVCMAKSEDDCKQADCAKDGCTYHSDTQTCQK
jgi:hypothetical protein